jgi:hypothetical protein
MQRGRIRRKKAELEGPQEGPARPFEAQWGLESRIHTIMLSYIPHSVKMLYGNNIEREDAPVRTHFA